MRELFVFQAAADDGEDSRHTAGALEGFRAGHDALKKRMGLTGNQALPVTTPYAASAIASAAAGLDVDVEAELISVAEEAAMAAGRL